MSKAGLHSAGLQMDVRRSGIWQMSSVVLSCGGACVVVDPGYFPRELEELQELATRRGDVAATVFTHGHWDHVIGWQAFPGAAVWASPSLAAAVDAGSEIAERNLADAREFDGRWYVERPAPLRWPAAVRGVRDGEVVRIGTAEVRALLLPGHSPDGLALLLDGVLLLGDYLSPCEIPFVEHLHDYRATLGRLLGMLGREVGRVIPGHGRPLDAGEARAIGTEDLRYLDALARCAEAQDRTAALDVPLPRAAAVPGMADHHIENCDKALAEAHAGR